jgi:hypothetical protein
MLMHLNSYKSISIHIYSHQSMFVHINSYQFVIFRIDLCEHGAQSHCPLGHNNLNVKYLNVIEYIFERIRIYFDMESLMYRPESGAPEGIYFINTGSLMYIACWRIPGMGGSE